MSAFPQTDWIRLAALREGRAEDKQRVLGELFGRYRDPVLAYLRGRGSRAEQAEDLVQDFFLHAIRHGLFEKADASRGRFRNLLLTALQHYAAKAHRAEHALRRRPAGGFAGNDVADLPEGALPADHATPERAFLRGWALTLIRRVLVVLEKEYAGPDRRAHYEIFRRLLIAPILEGTGAPTQHELAGALGLTEKEVANRLVTARRAYQRLLREEIATYARSEAEIDEEVRELFQKLSQP
ncbi:sigma factor [Opitutus sp. GAS368]|jgi:DNA-directed RNA polymerase specialized sigma24 family protein|uniref:RNA polymerase sigma factor n=1 Tax=Opitutus sp. GAS368 TaxID=1882749 RepID=UPI00087AB360|nr:sigma factor [Opitutus sp. GAS368]SDS02783.1 DNA-directed RNA polymerase specialized sigma subunit, sigma24 family [Opitutus sp. GAS368]